MRVMVSPLLERIRRRDAKVGVVGSGKGMTDYKTSNRHDFAAD